MKIRWFLGGLLTVVVGAGILTAKTSMTEGSCHIKMLALALDCPWVATLVPLGLIDSDDSLGTMHNGDIFICRWPALHVFGIAMPTRKIHSTRKIDRPKCMRPRIRWHLNSQLGPGVSPGSFSYLTCQPFSATAAFTFSIIKFASASVNVFSND